MLSKEFKEEFHLLVKGLVRQYIKENTCLIKLMKGFDFSRYRNSCQYFVSAAITVLSKLEIPFVVYAVTLKRREPVNHIVVEFNYDGKWYVYDGLINNYFDTKQHFYLAKNYFEKFAVNRLPMNAKTFYLKDMYRILYNYYSKELARLRTYL